DGAPEPVWQPVFLSTSSRTGAGLQLASTVSATPPTPWAFWASETRTVKLNVRWASPFRISSPRVPERMPSADRLRLLGRLLLPSTDQVLKLSCPPVAWSCTL